MAKGSGATRLSSTRAIVFPSYAVSRFGGTVQLGWRETSNILLSLGNIQEDVDSIKRLIDKHSAGGDGQSQADETLYKLINDSKSKLGKTLRDLARINTEQFNLGHQSGDDVIIWRGGDRKNTEAWTTRGEGADVGSGRVIVPDYSSSIRKMLRTHYMLGGISQMVGAPGESEILFIKKKR